MCCGLASAYLCHGIGAVEEEKLDYRAVAVHGRIKQGREPLWDADKTHAKVIASTSAFPAKAVYCTYLRNILGIFAVYMHIFSTVICV